MDRTPEKGPSPSWNLGSTTPPIREWEVLPLRGSFHGFECLSILSRFECLSGFLSGFECLSVFYPVVNAYLGLGVYLLLGVYLFYAASGCMGRAPNQGPSSSWNLSSTTLPGVKSHLTSVCGRSENFRSDLFFRVTARLEKGEGFEHVHPFVSF